MGKHKKEVDCASCKGTGKVTIGSDNGNRRDVPCVLCNGTGKV